MKKALLGLAVAAALCLGTTGRANADLLVNGGFETGDFTGWTLSGNTGSTFVGTDNPMFGSYAADLGPVGSLGFMSQTLGTTAGQAYTINFYLANDTGEGGGAIQAPHAQPPIEFLVNWNGNTVFDLSNPGNLPFSHFSLTETALGGDTLSFGFRNDPGFFFLDGSSVTLASGIVPEPGASATLALGAFLIGGLILRRRLSRIS